MEVYTGTFALPVLNVRIVALDVLAEVLRKTTPSIAQRDGANFMFFME